MKRTLRQRCWGFIVNGLKHSYKVRVVSWQSCGPCGTQASPSEGLEMISKEKEGKNEGKREIGRSQGSHQKLGPVVALPKNKGFQMNASSEAKLERKKKMEW